MHGPSPSRRGIVGGLLATAALRAAPVRAALDRGSLEAAASKAAELEQFRSLSIAHRGETVFERAFRGHPPDRPVAIKSISKTFVASVLGAAIDRGVVSGVDATLGALIPDRIPRGADPRVAAITLEDLVTMRAGLERTSGANYGAWVSSRDWVTDALSRPMVAEPGARFLYSTGSFHVLGAALSRATGRSLRALTQDWLGDPLGFDIPDWVRDPQGLHLGGNGMALSPRDLIRFGEMARLGGRYGETRVLSAEWMAAAWTPRTRSPFSGHDYGYGWFLWETRGHRVAYARGYGGQMLYVAPSLELTVAVTSDPTRPARSRGYGGVLNRLFAEIAAAVG